MNIGSTSTFSQSRDEICTDALTNLGAVAPGKDAAAARTAGLLAHAARALNRLVKSMDADGQFLWRVARRSQTVTATTNNIQTLNDVLDVDEPMGIYAATPGDGSDRTAVVSMSRDEWMTLRRTAGDIPVETGRPTRYFIEHLQSSVVIDTVAQCHLDRLADQDYIVEYAAFIRSPDITAGNVTPGFPTKWISCLVYGLTAELAPAYRQYAFGVQQRQLFEAEKARLLADDNERGPLTLVPFGRGVW